MAVKEYPKNPTPEQIQEWKNTYEGVARLIFPAEKEIQMVKQPNPDPKSKEKEIEVEEEVEIYPEAICYLKYPDRKELSYAQRASESGGKIAFNESILNTCFLGGDPIVKTKTSYFLGAGGYIADIIEVKECKLEKL